MVELLISTADWHQEKHVPVIEPIGPIKGGQTIKFNISVGKEIPHPNTTEHHIEWIQVFFHMEGEKFPFELAKFEFTSHGASGKGPNTSMVFTNPEGVVSFKTEKPGTLFALAYCNIHGLWKNSHELKLE